ncbi:hypothetical protein TL16_g03548 [Triparma laevis f. inornata]|uniref:Acylamino-acid-releasing enzyme n=1 Tax=Triparma laevis f. inornata TaxID=1714386 RepID=A0A9W7A6D9_9STRA|nr:hypothetical protein TL16_g03548 [Triparma laevis f. inornata]
MDSPYSFTSSYKDYSENKKEEVLNVITPDYNTVEASKPYKSKFTPATLSTTITHNIVPGDKSDKSTLTITSEIGTVLTIACKSHTPQFGGRYGGICYSESSNTVYYVGKNVDEEVYAKDHFPSDDSQKNKPPKHLKYVVGNEIGYGESDGEQMLFSNADNLRLYTLNLSTYCIAPLPKTSGLYNPTLIPGKHLLACKNKEPYKKLGKVYCYNRPQEVVVVESEEGSGPYRPLGYERNLINVNDQLVSFGLTKVFGSHVGYVNLYVNGQEVDLSNVGNQIVLVDDDVSLFNSCVNGDELLINVWVGMECKIVKLNVKSLSVEYTNLGNVWEKLGRSYEGYMLLRYDEDKVYLKVSSQTDPGGLLIIDKKVWSGGESESGRSVDFIKYKPRQASGCKSPLLSFSANFTVEQVNMNFSGNNTLPECSIYKPNNLSSPKIILVPHGGPHSVSPMFFSPAMAWLANLGYCVVTCNYRGETSEERGARSETTGMWSSSSSYQRTFYTNSLATLLGSLRSSLAQVQSDTVKNT